MSHWLLDAMAEQRCRALREADRVQFYREMGQALSDFDAELLRETAAALEIAVLDLKIDRLAYDPEQLEMSRQAAAEAFRLLRVLPQPEDPMACLLYTSPSPRDDNRSRMPSSA